MVLYIYTPPGPFQRLGSLNAIPRVIRLQAGAAETQIHTFVGLNNAETRTFGCDTHQNMRAQTHTM